MGSWCGFSRDFRESCEFCGFLQPTVVGDGSWHGFCGYQNSGTRSPSLWVNWNGGDSAYTEHSNGERAIIRFFFGTVITN